MEKKKEKKKLMIFIYKIHNPSSIPGVFYSHIKSVGGIFVKYIWVNLIFMHTPYNIYIHLRHN